VAFGGTSATSAEYNSLTKAATIAPASKIIGQARLGALYAEQGREDTKQNLLVFDTLPPVPVVLLYIEPSKGTPNFNQ
jgi:hypothetical protein